MTDSGVDSSVLCFFSLPRDNNDCGMAALLSVGPTAGYLTGQPLAVDSGLQVS